MTHTTHAFSGAVGLTRRQIVSSLMLGGAALMLAGCENGSSAGSKSSQFKGLDISSAKYAQDFSLPDMNGQQRSMADFRGKVVAMFFGFVQCPDVCPTTMQLMSNVVQQLGPEGKDVRILFVSVDPKRDSNTILRAYTQAFSPNAIGLTGSMKQIDAITRRYRVAFSYGKPDAQELAKATGKPVAEISLPTFRQPVAAISLGALAGGERHE